MAIVTPGGIEMTGKVGDLVIYKRKDINRVIVREKGSLTKEDIRDKPEFEPTRKINREFGGRSRFSGRILKAMLHMRGLSDYNLAGPLNALLKPVQEMDTVREVGKRSIELSRNPGILEGFPLNKRNVFEVVVRLPLKYKVSKDELKAEIETPALIPQVNFFPVDQYPVFRWQACLAIFPDLHYSEGDEKYIHLTGGKRFINSDYTGQWSVSSEGTEGSLIELSVSPLGEVENFSMILTVGIAFGTMRPGGPAAVKYAGCGKVLRGV